jgi:hypothetical protein
MLGNDADGADTRPAADIGEHDVVRVEAAERPTVLPLSVRDHVPTVVDARAVHAVGKQHSGSIELLKMAGNSMRQRSTGLGDLQSSFW